MGDATDPHTGGTLGATLKLAISPRFPSRSLLSPGQLLSLIQNTRVSPWRRTSFPLSHKAVLSQHESALVLDGGRGRFSLLEANIWGLLFYACEIEQPANTEGRGIPGTIHLHDFVGRLLVFLEHARQSYAIIGYDGTLEIRMVLERMRGKPFIHFPEGFAMKGPESYLDDNISFDLSSPSLRLHTSRDAVAVDILRILLFAVNFSEIAMEDTQTYRLLDHGYEFNIWPPRTQ